MQENKLAILQFFLLRLNVKKETDRFAQILAWFGKNKFGKY